MGPPAPEGCMGQVWEGTSPRWAGAPPHKGPRRLGFGEGAPPPCLGGKFPPLPPLGRHPRWVWGCRTPWGGNPKGGAPPPSPLYILEVFGAADTRVSTSPWRSPTSLPPPLPRCLAKPCRIATRLHHHHAVVLLLDGVFLNLSLSPCWIKAWETSPGCTCVERGGAVRSTLGSPVIWITTSTTPSTLFS